VEKEEMPLGDLFLQLKQSGDPPRLPDGRILVELIIPAQKPGSGAGYEKTTVMISPMSSAVASAAAWLCLDPREKTIKECRIAIGSCTSYPYRGKKAEEYLIGKPFGEAILEDAAEMAVSGLEPVSDNYGSAEYRAMVAGVMVRRALEKAGSTALIDPSR
jgi:CO/xanthine dehydrogenase FAD-binding subunit